MTTYLTADEIRALPEHSVIIRHDPVEGPIAYQRRGDRWWGTMSGHDRSTDGLCFGIDAYGDRYTLAWAPEVES